jgi:hypothetical protein
MTWGFIWLMFILKIPILMLFGIVWWATHQTDEEPTPEEKARITPRPSPHPHDPVKRRRPRGPHSGEPAVLPSPPRVRPVTAIAAKASAERDHHDA